MPARSEHSGAGAPGGREPWQAAGDARALAAALSKSGFCKNSMAGEYFAVGFADGLKKARMKRRAAAVAAGQAEILVRFLEVRFGALPKRLRAELSRARPEHLDAVLDEAWEAESIDEIVVGERLSALLEKLPQKWRTAVKREVEQWVEDSIRDGIAEGRAWGGVWMLVRILETRFGAAPKRIQAQLESAAPKRREAALERIGEAESLGDIVVGERLSALLEKLPQKWCTLVRREARAWAEEGRFDGIMEGGIEGGTAMLVRVLERRFGALPEKFRARLARATSKRLETVLERMWSAESIGEVMGGRAR